MTTPTPIRVKCPKCGAVARGNDSHLARDIKCPRCQEVVRFVPVTDQPSRPAHDPISQPQTPPHSQPEPTSIFAGTTFFFNNDGISQDSEQHDTQVIPGQEPPGHASSSIFQTNEYSASIFQFDNNQKITASIAGGGLLILGLSPFFWWLKFGGGGITGLAGDGKILLAVTVVAAAAYTAVIVKRKWLAPVLLTVQAWGTIVMFWMGALIWKVGSILNSPDVEDNSFAVMSSAMISPGAGLYLGLIGGITVSAALGFLAGRLLLAEGNLKLFYTSQGIACALGILLAFLVGPDYTPTNESSVQNTEQSVDGEWQETHNVSDTQLDEMAARYQHLTRERRRSTLETICQLGQ